MAEDQEAKIITDDPLRAVYDILSNKEAPCHRLPKSAMDNLRTVAKDWASAFDGKKLVIMGENHELIQLLEAADADEDIDLDWDHATVSLHETGWGTPDYYTGRYTMKYKWDSTIESEYEMYAKTKEGLVLESEEIVPTDYFETIEPDDEECEMGDHGAEMERDFNDEDAIVVWPRSMTWIVANGNDVGDMIDHLSESLKGSAGPDSVQSCRLKAQFLCDRLSQEKKVSGSLLNNFLTCLKAIGDSHLTAAFTTTVFQKQFHALSHLMETVGSMVVDDMHYQNFEELILETATVEKIALESIQTPFNLATASWSALGANPGTTELASEIVERCIRALAIMSQCTNGMMTVQMVQSLLSVFTGPEAVPNRAKVAPLFIQNVAQLSSTTYKPEERWYNGKLVQKEKPAPGPEVLLGTGLPELCNEMGWSHFETTFKEVMRQLHEGKAFGTTISLVRELSKPVGDSPVSPEQSVLCTRLADTLFGSIMGKGLDLSTKSRIELLLLIDLYSPGLLNDFIQEVHLLDTNTELYPLVIGLLKNPTWKTPSIPESILSLALACAQTLSSKMTAVTSKVKDWAMTDVVVPDNIPTSKSSHWTSVASIRRFLDDPREHTYSAVVVKMQVEPFIESLQGLTDAGHVRMEPYLDHRWHVKIEKLRYKLVPVTSVSCDCHRVYDGVEFGGKKHSEGCVVAPFATRIDEQKASQRQFPELMKLLPSDVQANVRRQAPCSRDTTSTLSTTADGELKKRAKTKLVAPFAKKQKKVAEVVDLTDD